VVEGPLRRGVGIALQVRADLQQHLGITVSCGVAPGKLLARLVGPLNKPDSVTVLPAGSALAFLQSQRIQDVPQLRGKGGSQVRTGHALHLRLQLWCRCEIMI